MQFIEFLKDIVNFICDPRILISLAALFLCSFRSSGRKVL